ncbi:Cullin family-domain-containing protein [Mycena olivaceomarginata]|nr:Cullin family-domain-containing protein [Mycena olivaceomarginata]
MRRATANTVGRYGGRLESEARAWCMRERKGRSHRAPEAAAREATSQAVVESVSYEWNSEVAVHGIQMLVTSTPVRSQIFHLPSHTHTHNPGNNQLIIFGGMSNEPNEPNELQYFYNNWLNDVCVYDLRVTDKLNESKGFFPPLASYVPRSSRPITSAILRMVAAQRDGAQIDQALVKKVVDSFVSLSLDAADPNKECLDIYKEQFEAPFLAAIAAYYAAEAEAFLNAGGTEGSRNIPEYLKKAGGGCARRRRGWCGICMQRRGKSWWGSQSPPLIIPGTFLVLILHPALLDFDADEDLQRMYALLACIPEGLEPLGKKFEAHIKATGLGAVSTLVGAQGAAGTTTDADAKSTELDPKAYINVLLAVHHEKNAAMHGVRLFVGTSAAQSLGLLAKHADMLLRKINKVTGDVDLEGALNRVVGHLPIRLLFDDAHGVLIEAMRHRWWSAEEEEALKVRLKADMMQAFKRAEVLPQHELGKLFTAVYAGEGPLNIHFRSPKYHFPTISSTLATQIPQAAGVAYALHWTSKRRSRSIAACFFGEGAASEGAHRARSQFYSDSIASRGPGYGIDTVRATPCSFCGLFQVWYWPPACMECGACVQHCLDPIHCVPPSPEQPKRSEMPNYGTKDKAWLG